MKLLRHKTYNSASPGVSIYLYRPVVYHLHNPVDDDEDRIVTSALSITDWLDLSKALMAQLF